MRKLVVLFVFLLNTLCVVAATGQGTKQPSAGKINISGSMVNERGEAVSVLKPNDIVRFKVRSDRDCYIAIMMVDARGEKSWLATVNNFLEAGIVRTFPDIAGATLRASDDGVSGDEYVVIYACTDEIAEQRRYRHFPKPRFAYDYEATTKCKKQCFVWECEN